MVGLVHFLGVSARRRRHDFGVLRALGFVRRDLSLTMSWQAMSVVAVGVVAGVPLGVMVGRWAWLAAIGSVGMVDTPAVPGVYRWLPSWSSPSAGLPPSARSRAGSPAADPPPTR